ncbi:hypothetical protein AAF712_000279 [Marasmius tenuissimus]|uniref:Uncharacterized protein n=1 Tax=Marasmius tenuissimus TaxID=585030 RepID=A0ABR3AF13_9AGAR
MQMPEPGSITKVTSIVSSLGGPQISPPDLEWALELEGGKRLFDWLASQLSTVYPSEGTYELGEAARIRAALSTIALEDEEVNGLKQPGTETKVEFTSLWEPILPNYITSGRQRHDREYLTLLNNLRFTLENEVAILSKTIDSRLSNSLRQTRFELEQIRIENSTVQDRLAELSTEVDAAVSTAKYCAMKLLDTVPELSSDEGSSCFLDIFLFDVNSLIKGSALLFRMSSQRKAVVDQYKRAIQAIEGVKSTCIPSQMDMELQAGHLINSLQGIQPERQSIQDAALAEELVTLARIVDNSDSEVSEILQCLKLKQDDVTRTPSTPALALVQQELEVAWCRDQEVLVDTRISALEKALRNLKNLVVPSSRVLYGALTENADHSDRVLTLVDKVREEVDNITGNIRQAKEHAQAQAGPAMAQKGRSVLQSQATDLLRSMKDFRSPHAGPLVLLDGRDVFSELEALNARRDIVEEQEERWANEMSFQLNVLLASHNSALSAVYAHSPLNTSEPYSTSPNVVDVRRMAQEQRDGLISVVGNMDKEVKATMEGERTQKKLKSFVDQWIGVNDKA